MTIRVDEELPIFYDSVKYQGDGRVIGWALKKDITRDDGPLVSSFRFNRCSKVACPGPKGNSTITTEHDLKDGVLQPGVYRLYLVADGAPVTFIFKFFELEGKVALNPTEKAEVDIKTLTPHVVRGPERTVYSAGDYTDLEGPAPGYSAVGLWVLGDEHFVTAFGSCAYNFEFPALPPEIAFAPGCSLTRTRTTPLTTSGDRGGVIYTSRHPELHSGFGAWFASAARVRKSGAVGVWLKYT